MNDLNDCFILEILGTRNTVNGILLRQKNFYRRSMFYQPSITVIGIQIHTIFPYSLKW